jgi:uncharacterized protein YutE (UPF0331/DUF86 family)
MEDLLPRLKDLEDNLRVLRDFKSHPFDEIRSDKKLLWGLRYGMLECLQIVIDTACAVVSYYNLGNPKSYAECIEILGRERFLTGQLTEHIVKAVGLRNILVHEYFGVDDELVYRSLNDLMDIEEFSRQILRNTGGG